jgi:ABC-type uncharacterized transport system substrate-binding protein
LNTFFQPYRILAALALWLFAGSGVQAATVVVVLSNESATYQEVAEAISQEIGSEHKVVRVLADKLGTAAVDLSDAKLLLTIGTGASEQASGYAGKIPILAALVPKDWYQKNGRAKLAENGRLSGAVVLDQPYSRQLRLIKMALPTASKVGVLFSHGNDSQLAEIEQAARPLRMSVNAAVINAENELVGTLEKTLAHSDVLLAVPDPMVLNRNTVQSLFITSYRTRIPVVGYSKSLSRAGALLVIYSTPAQIGRQAGEIAEKFLHSGKLSGLQWPKYFSIASNSHVTRSLDINIAPEQDLLRGLLEGGGHD